MSGDDCDGIRFGRGGTKRGSIRGIGGRGRGRVDYNSKNAYNEAEEWGSSDSYSNKESSYDVGGGQPRKNEDNFDYGDDGYNDNTYKSMGRGINKRGTYNSENDTGERKNYFGRGADTFGGRDDNRRGGGRGMGRRGGRNANGLSENGYSNKKDDADDDSPNMGEDGGKRRGGERSGGDGDGEKPKERYIPPDPTEDENEMFGSGITSGINFSKYDNIRVKVSGDNCIPPIDSFQSAGLRELVYSNVCRSGYTVPTPIQKYALPSIMAGRDIMACAQTGSGKTAAFLIPIINTLIDCPSDLVITSTSVEPQAIILSPTRELTIQIFNEARKFAHGSIIKVAMVYGGTATFHQASILMRGCHILVATPGRLNDFISRGKLTFSSVRYFVLDEADRMLDLGFKPAIEQMLVHETMVPVGERQTILFSATFPEDIQKMALNFLHNYLFIAVGIVGGACSDVQQIFHQVARFDKKEKLKEILSENEGKEKTLVFVEQKRTADFIAALLSENGFPTTSIHGDRLQSQREMALNDFKIGRMPTLVATAVAARGLDIKNVGHVINYDLPSTIEEYVHRIGRTGRVGNRGKATSFYDPSQDSTLACHLVTILEQTNQEIPDFLLEGGGGERGVGSSASDFGKQGDHGFGGRDVRRGPSKTTEVPAYSNAPVSLEEEEEW